MKYLKDEKKMLAGKKKVISKKIDKLSSSAAPSYRAGPIA